MHSGREAIEAYILAKDGNRPFLMGKAFAEDAVLEVSITGGTITFPPTLAGLESMSTTLVREFARTYENIHTFCLTSPPNADATTFSCRWLVGMSEKESRNARVGCGRYDWHFRSRVPRVAASLKITVQIMESLPPATLVPIMDWLLTLPYPWCPAHQALKRFPNLAELLPIREYLANSSTEPIGQSDAPMHGFSFTHIGAARRLPPTLGPDRMESNMAENAGGDRNAMSFAKLLDWAWRETPSVHANRTNLLIHIVAVPLFVFGHVLLIVGLFITPWLFMSAPLAVVVSLVAQKWGHSLERNQVHPFTGGRDFLRRLYAEQFCNFWRFVLSGRWYASFRARSSGA